jgi:hypothetical protein
LKTRLLDAVRNGWLLLTAVPGWPDAPWSRRLRRSLPIVLPTFGCLALLSWQVGYQQPRLNGLRAQYEPLLGLEAEVAHLRLAYSAQQVQELAEAEAALISQLPRDLREVREVAQALEREATAAGWIGTFRVGEPMEDPDFAASPFRLVPIRARLVPADGLEAPVVSLLTYLEKIRTGPRRIDLMRLAISADDGTWQGVELGLRLAVPTSHAQVPE